MKLSLVIGPRNVTKSDFLLLVKYMEKITEDDEVFIIRGLPGFDYVPLYMGKKVEIYPPAHIVFRDGIGFTYTGSYHAEDLTREAIKFSKLIGDDYLMKINNQPHKMILSDDEPDRLFFLIGNKLDKVYFLDDNLDQNDKHLFTVLKKAYKSNRTKYKFINLENFRYQNIYDDKDIQLIKKWFKNCKKDDLKKMLESQILDTKSQFKLLTYIKKQKEISK